MNEIFTHFLSRDAADDKRRVAYMEWFCDNFPEDEFSGQDRLFREYAEWSSRLKVPFKSKYLVKFCNNELKPILIKHNIKIPGTDSLNFTEPTALATAVRVSTEVMLGSVTEMEREDTEVDDFKISADTFIHQRRNERLTEILGKTFEIVSDTESAENAADYASAQISYIQEIYDKEALEELVDEHDNGEFLEIITDTGIEAIDNDIRGIYRTRLAGIEAQPGTGKTRFTLGVWVYRAAVVYKHNALFFTLEQTVREMETILIAHHVYMLYKIQIDDSMILENRVPEEYKHKVQAAELDLFHSGKYGKIKIVETSLYLETFIDKIKTLDALHGPFDLIAIDYMGLIEQKEGKYMKYLQDYQIIGRSFKKFKRYLRRTRKAGVAVSQFNDKGIEAGKADQTITTNMAQGGIEVYRNTDTNIALSMTEEMRIQQKRRVSQPKVRNSTGFGNFILDCRLGISHFYQIKTRKV